MEIIDAQVHIVGPKDSNEWPWDPEFGAAWGNMPPELAKRIAKHDSIVDGDTMIREMDAVGVDCAVLVATSHYGWNDGYSVAAANRYKGRFGVVGRINPDVPDVEDQVAKWRSNPVALGLRVLMVSPALREKMASGGHDRLLSAAQRENMPICINISGALPELLPIADRFPNLRFVIDHLGLKQPPLQEADPDRFQRLPELLALAERPNISVKLTGTPTLSMQNFPFEDIWPALHRIIDAFGTNRLMWGSDWTRIAGVATYAESVRFITETDEIGPEEKRLILGANLRNIFDWRHPA